MVEFPHRWAGHGLGAETLMESGLIAGGSSAEYHKTFNLKYVTASWPTCRLVPDPESDNRSIEDDNGANG
jgi:hypothetical protein